MYSPVLNTKQRLTHSHAGDKKRGGTEARRGRDKQFSEGHSSSEPSILSWLSLFQSLGKVFSLKLRAFT